MGNKPFRSNKICQDKFDLLQQKSSAQRQQLEELISILQDRVELENYYSRTIEKIGKEISKLSFKG